MIAPSSPSPCFCFTFIHGKLSLFATAFRSKFLNLRKSRNGSEDRKRAKRGESYVNFEDKVEVQWAIRALGKSLSDD